MRFRVLGVDTPELRGGTDETKAAAKLAKARVEELLADAGEGFPLTIVTKKADSFGRWLAAIYFIDHEDKEESLAAVLIAEGLGVERLK